MFGVQLNLHPTLTLTRPWRCWRNRRPALWQINQPNLASLLPQIEIARPPIDKRENSSRYEQVSDPNSDRDRLSGTGQIQPIGHGIDCTNPAPTVEPLQRNHNDGRNYYIDKRRRQHPFPTKIHQLIVTKPRQRPA